MTNLTIEPHPWRDQSILLVDWDTGTAYPFSRGADNVELLGWDESDLAQLAGFRLDHYGLKPRSAAPEPFDGIRHLLENYMSTDGEHHKQWLLERIADIVGVDHENEGIAP